MASKGVVLLLAAIFGLPALWALTWLVPGRVTSGALGHSVLREAGSSTDASLDSGTCESEREDLWNCSVSDFSGNTGYRVETEGWSCWEATSTGESGEASLPESLDGCVKLGDNFRISERLFGDLP
jgi:hypothetical protein